MGKWFGAAVPAFLLLAGCSAAPAVSEDLPSGPAPLVLEALTFNRTVQIMQGGFGLAFANAPLDESCLAIRVTRGFVPFWVHASQTWEAQSTGGQELWLALFEDDESQYTAAEEGSSPVLLSHEWRIGRPSVSRPAETDRVLQFVPSLSKAGVAVQQEVHVEVALTFAKFPEADDADPPYAVPC
jgi:hypothetical protein